MVAASLKKEEWTEILDRAGVPCAPVQNVKQMLEHEQMRSLGLLQAVAGSSVPMIGLPLSFDGRRPDAGRASPALGEFTEEWRRLNKEPR